MKKRIALSLLCCALLVSALSGCANYDEIKTELDNVTIDNLLEEVDEDASYQHLAEIDDIVYRQQIAACRMYTEAYEKTNYKNLATEDLDEDKVSRLCTKRREEIHEDIELAYGINMYRLLQDVTDCSNVDAYVIKTHDDVLDFYDIYDKYLNDDSQQALMTMILHYSQRSNLLALSFLGSVKEEVCRAALTQIEENASNDEDLRMYVNLNNDIVSALNTLYGTIPDSYAERITEVNTDLAERYLESLDELSDKEKADLLSQLRPTEEPTPTPLATATPTPAPTPTQRPTATPKPADTATKAPSATQAPTAKATSAPTTTTQRPTSATSAPSATQRPATSAPTDPPINFDMDDDETSYNTEYDFRVE